MVILELQAGEVVVDRLTAAQQDGSNGRLAGAMAAYLRWLASRLDKRRERVHELVRTWRHRSLSHRRAPEALGMLAAGLESLLDFALEVGALDQNARQSLLQDAETAFLDVGLVQGEHQRVADVVERFLCLLGAALASGDAHLANADADALPPKALPERWGWWPRTLTGNGEAGEHPLLEPQGRCIGWVREQDVYLEPDAAYREVQRFATAQGEPLSVTPRTLWRRVAERGLLASHEDERTTAKVPYRLASPPVNRIGSFAVHRPISGS
jgi:hypothetical protein